MESRVKYGIAPAPLALALVAEVVGKNDESGRANVHLKILNPEERKGAP